MRDGLPSRYAYLRRTGLPKRNVSQRKTESPKRNELLMKTGLLKRNALLRKTVSQKRRDRKKLRRSKQGLKSFLKTRRLPARRKKKRLQRLRD